MAGNTRRVRATDPESAELADVAIAGLTVLADVWREQEGCPTVAGFWQRIRYAVECQPTADLQTCLDAARGLRDLRQRYPFLDELLDEVADRVEQRAWARERQRLGMSPKVDASA